MLHTVKALAGIASGEKLVPCVVPQASVSSPSVSWYQLASRFGSGERKNIPPTPKTLPVAISVIRSYSLKNRCIHIIILNGTPQRHYVTLYTGRPTSIVILLRTQVSRSLHPVTPSTLSLIHISEPTR